MPDVGQGPEDDGRSANLVSGGGGPDYGAPVVDAAGGDGQTRASSDVVDYA